MSLQWELIFQSCNEIAKTGFVCEELVARISNELGLAREIR